MKFCLCCLCCFLLGILSSIIYLVYIAFDNEVSVKKYQQYIENCYVEELNFEKKYGYLPVNRRYDFRYSLILGQLEKVGKVLKRVNVCNDELKEALEAIQATGTRHYENEIRALFKDYPFVRGTAFRVFWRTVPDYKERLSLLLEALEYDKTRNLAEFLLELEFGKPEISPSKNNEWHVFIEEKKSIIDIRNEMLQEARFLWASNKYNSAISTLSSLIETEKKHNVNGFESKFLLCEAYLLTKENKPAIQILMNFNEEEQAALNWLPPDIEPLPEDELRRPALLWLVSLIREEDLLPEFSIIGNNLLKYKMLCSVVNNALKHDIDFSVTRPRQQPPLPTTNQSEKQEE